MQCTPLLEVALHVLSLSHNHISLRCISSIVLIFRAKCKRLHFSSKPIRIMAEPGVWACTLPIQHLLHPPNPLNLFCHVFLSSKQSVDFFLHYLHVALQQCYTPAAIMFNYQNAKMHPFEMLASKPDLFIFKGPSLLFSDRGPTLNQIPLNQ